jgi:multidrug efflux pump subunit AcrB
MSTQPLTYTALFDSFREIRETLRENAEQMKETDRRMRETDQRMKETDRIVQENAQQIGRLGSRIGEIVENMVGGNIVTKFQNYGYNVTEISRNIKFGIQGTTSAGEIDVLLDDGDVAILIEAKTKLTADDVHDHIERLEKYRRWKDGKGEGKKRYIGAVASTVVDDNVVKFAQTNGMYVIVQSGYAVEILDPPEGFKAKEW